MGQVLPPVVGAGGGAGVTDGRGEDVNAGGVDGVNVEAGGEGVEEAQPVPQLVAPSETSKHPVSSAVVV